MFRDSVENELAQSRPVTWDMDAPVFHQAKEVSIVDALSVIDGLPNDESAVVMRAETLLSSKAHRYA
jgi:hypothetical protein